MNMFTLAGSATRKAATVVTYSQRCEVEVSLIAQKLSLETEWRL